MSAGTDIINEEEDRMAEYPEHEKLKKVSAESQKVGAFLDWLMNEQHVVLCRHHQHDDACDCADDWHDDDEEGGPERCPTCDSRRPSVRNHACGMWEDYPNTLRGGIEDWLASYFEIDRDAIEREKRAMLDGIRKANAA